ncbi:MAG: hypothetical protein HQL96_11755 [Magnetococcales bacterium]|nr:hypothetical protein [Magnetococcales bacterium]
MTASAELLPILDQDLEAACRFLHENINRTISPQAWQLAYSQPWLADAPNHGFMLVDQGRVVGVFMAIYSAQTIRGATERFCNQNSWVVLEPYRHLGLGLWRALQAQSGYHVTMLTPNPTVAKVYQTRRYRPIGAAVTVLPAPLPWPLARQARVVVEEEAQAVLPAAAARDLVNHRPFPWLTQLALGDAERGYCLVVGKLGRWKRLPALRVLHVSDGAIFASLHPALGRHLFRRYGVITLHVPSRCLPTRTGFEITDTQPRLFLSDRLEERDITWLYTELVALDLPM